MTDNLKGHYAGFISRLFAFSIDIVIIVVVLIFAGWHEHHFPARHP